MNAAYGLFARVTLPLAALNFLNQASRTVMAIVGPVLAVEFALSASELGLLAACMFAAYAAVQLPVGMALDLLGTRRVQSALGLVTAAGFAAFALSDSLAGFSVSRVILGVGISAGLMAILKANTQWFAPAQVAGMTGLAMGVATLGSVLTTAPVEAALPWLGWRGVFWLLAGISVAVAAWVFVSVRDKPRPAAPRALREELAVMGRIFASPLFWRYGPAAAMLSILNFTYLGLWAGPWLRDVAGYDGPARAQTLLFYTLAMTAGTLASGQASSRVQARGGPALLVPATCFAALLAAQIGLALQPSGAAVTVLWVLFAFFGAAGPTAYVAVGQMFPAEQMGRVSTAINTLTLGGAFLLQAAIGAILDLWPRAASGGWDPDGYSAALLVSVAAQLLIVAAARRRSAARS
jgi:predicted MFS family arabinose efflux permease